MDVKSHSKAITYIIILCTVCYCNENNQCPSVPEHKQERGKDGKKEGTEIDHYNGDRCNIKMIS